MDTFNASELLEGLGEYPDKFQPYIYPEIYVWTKSS